MKTKSTLLIALLALSASAVFAQTPDPNAGADPSRRDRGRGNYEEFRQRMNERLKASLKVTDDEWAVIQPLIDKVQTKMRDASGGRFGGGQPRGSSTGGTGGASASTTSAPPAAAPPANPDPTRPERAGSAEREALREALENESTSPDELKTKLAAVREQRKKATAELAEAREDLKKVLTVRQEAALVSFGLLE